MAATETDFLIRIVLQAKDNFSAAFTKAVGDVDQKLGRIVAERERSGGTFMARLLGVDDKGKNKIQRDVESVLDRVQKEFDKRFGEKLRDEGYLAQKLGVNKRELESVKQTLNDFHKAMDDSLAKANRNAEGWKRWRQTINEAQNPANVPGAGRFSVFGPNAEREAAAERTRVERAIRDAERLTKATRGAGLGGGMPSFPDVTPDRPMLGRRDDDRGVRRSVLSRAAIGATRGAERSAAIALRGVTEAADAAGEAAASMGTKMIQAGKQAASGFGNAGLLGKVFLSTLGLILAVLPLIVTAIYGLAGALVALASSAMMAGAAIGGALVAGIGQALPVIGLLVAAFARFKEIMSISGQQSDLQKQQLGGASQAMDRQRQAAQNLIRAQEGLRDAQRNLADSRREAARHLQDLTLAERSARLEAQESSLASEDAQTRLRRALSRGGIRELREARIGSEKAALGGVQAQVGVQRATEDRARLTPGGVEGSREVIQAQRQLRDATWALADAQREAAKAASGQSAGLDAINAAIKELSPAEKALLDAVNRLKETWKRVMRPITDVIIESFTFVTNRINKLMSDPKTLAAFQTLAASLAKSIRIFFSAITTPEMQKVFRSFVTEGAKNLPIIAQAAASMFAAFARVGAAAAPILTELLTGFADWMKSFSDTTEDRKGLQDFFASAGEHLGAWLDLIGAIGGLFGETIRSAAPTGLGLVEGMTRGIRALTNWMRDHRPEVRKFFEEAADVARVLMGAILVMIPIIGKLFNPDAMKGFVNFIVKVIVPAAVDLFNALNLVWRVIGFIIGLPFVAELARWLVILLGVIGGVKLLRIAFSLLSKANWWMLVIAGLIMLESKFHVIQRVVEFFWDIIKISFNWVKDNWPLLLAILTGPLGLVIKFFYDHWGPIASWFSGLWDKIKTIFEAAWKYIDKYVIQPMKDAIEWIKSLLPGQHGTYDPAALADAIGNKNVTFNVNIVPGQPLVEGEQASGGIIRARPGGRIMRVGEGGHDEYVLTTDPSKRGRTEGLLGQFMQSFARGGVVPSQAPNATRDRGPLLVRRSMDTTGILGTIEAAKAWAEAMVGTPYKYGGGHVNALLPAGTKMDCSAFVSQVLMRLPGYRGGVGWTGSFFDATVPASGNEAMVIGFRGDPHSPKDGHMGVRLGGTWYDAGSGGVERGDSNWSSTKVFPGMSWSVAAAPPTPEQRTTRAPRTQAERQTKTQKPTFEQYFLGLTGNASDSPATKYLVPSARQWFAASQSGFAEGGELPGSEGAPRMIMAHAGEMILNRAQQWRLGGPRFLRNFLGFGQGDGESFQVGGEVGGARGALGQISQLQRRGLGQFGADLGSEANDPKVLQRLRQGFFNKIFEKLASQLVERFADVRDSIEEFRTKLSNTLENTKFHFDALGQVVRGSDQKVLEQTFIGLTSEYGALMSERGLINDSIKTAKQAIVVARRRLAAAKGAGARKVALQGLQAAQALLRDAMDASEANQTDLDQLAVRRYQAEQDRRDFDVSQAQLAVDNAERAQRKFDILGGSHERQMEIMHQREFGLRGVLKVLEGQYDAALAAGDSELAKDIGDKLDATRLLIASTVKAQADAAFDWIREIVSSGISNAERNMGLADTAMNLATAGAQTTDFGARASGLATQRAFLAGERPAILDLINAELDKPEDQRNLVQLKVWGERLEENTKEMSDNTLATRDNTRASENFVLQMGKDFMDQVVGITSSLARGAELTGDTDAQKRFIRQGLDAMKIEAARQKALQPTWDAQFAAGTMTFKEWSDNTKGLIDLNNTITETNQLLDGLGQAQSFASLTWQWFRQAVFTGSGELLPGFVPPGAATGGFIAKEGLVHLHAGEVVIPAGGMSNVTGDTHVNLNITNPTETADPIYLGQRVAWELRTAR